MTTPACPPLLIKNSGSIPRNACVACERKLWKVWPTDRQTDGRTDRQRTKWSLCVTMLRRRHKNLSKKKWPELPVGWAPLSPHTRHCSLHPNQYWKSKSEYNHNIFWICLFCIFFLFLSSEQNGNYFHLCAQLLDVQTALNLPNNVRRNGHYGYTIMRHISQKLKFEEGRMFKYCTNSPSPAEKVLIARILERKDWSFYASGLKDPPGTSSNRIVCPSVRPSVCLSVCPSVRYSAPLTNKVQYLKFGWWYNPQTWTVSSSMGSSHFTDITCPGDGAGSKCSTPRFLPYFDTVAAGCIRVSQTRLVFVCIGKWKDTGQV